MATNPHLFEDQTDEDFFDKLVDDDDFGLEGSSLDPDGIARDVSSLSIGEMETPAEDFSGDALEPKAVAETSAARSSENAVSAQIESTALASTTIKAATTSDDHPAEMPGTIVTHDAAQEKGAGSKKASIKEVQWSAFGGDSEATDFGGFGSYADLFQQGLDGPSDELEMPAPTLVPTSVPTSTPTSAPTLASIMGTDFSSLEHEEQIFDEISQESLHVDSTQQQDSQSTIDANDPQNWEDLYPGWKYDYSTGQWYQVDNFEPVSTGFSDGIVNTATSGESSIEASRTDAQFSTDESTTDQASNISYMQQASHSAVQTIAENYTIDSVSNWNQASPANSEYPPNMVFDPQYPGWYYDTNTGQWYSLEAYNQSLQTMTTINQNQPTTEENTASGGYSLNQNVDYANRSVQFENQVSKREIASSGSTDWGPSVSTYGQQNVWQPEPAEESKSGYSQNQQFVSFHGSTVEEMKSPSGFSGKQQTGNLHSPVYNTSFAPSQFDGRGSDTLSRQTYGSGNGPSSFQGFIPAQTSYAFHQPQVQHSQQDKLSQSYYGNQNILGYSHQSSQNTNVSPMQASSTAEGRSSAGRPPHALVTFGFGGKLIVMKNSDSNARYGSQDASTNKVSIMDLADVTENGASNSQNQNKDYFHTLCKQSFPGPLVGGNAATKDINKWLDERIANCESSSMDFREAELLRLLLSLLKISYQHYGKLRSPFGVDSSVLENDGPESAVTKLFASARKNGANLREYGAFTYCMHQSPSEAQMQATAAEVQQLLVSGKRKEALQCAQEGLLWGPAIVLAAQLGQEFYVDTVKQMAHRQFVSGSPLRTLCLLIAGQPADVFSTNNSSTFAPNGGIASNQVVASGMLDSWEENLALITANRTKDDELVIIHLGDCLWKERGEVTAAHTCYLVAESNFELYSETARLCLVGSDHLRFPRTYASPEAIQRTEVYEYSKVLGNSQFVLHPFQPYKLLYAHMLAEVGRISESLRYCQAILKVLKSSSRAPEVEIWKQLASSLEERLKTHQQGGYGTNLAPAKFVGKLFNSIDRSIHRMMGSPPPALPPIPPGSIQKHEHDNFSPSKVPSSQSTMAISSLMPSSSVETISEWAGDNKRTMHNRSVSEPDFGRSPKEASATASDGASTGSQGKASGSGGSRLGLFGSQIFQKTIGWVARSRTERQAKLGETNKFYYDEKLKRWVEEGAEPPAEQPALAPPPTAASFQNGVLDYDINNAFKSQSLPSANGKLENKQASSEQSPGIPPIPSPNQFSARGRMGVRSRYVDTFNKGASASSSFQSPSVPSLRPVSSAKFFVPTPVPANEFAGEQIENVQEVSSNEDASSTIIKDSPVSSISSSSSTFTMQRHPSMDNITPMRTQGMGPGSWQSNGSHPTRARAASWSGGLADPCNPKLSDFNKPTSFVPSNLSASSMKVNGSLGEELQEVEL